MNTNKEHLTILSDAEQAALYELPDFDNEQRFTYLTLTDNELQFALTRKSLSSKVYCILQIGYFKAVQLFFQVAWEDIDPEGIAFILQQYFPDEILDKQLITKHEYYAQCNGIASLFEYRIWSQSYQTLLYAHAPVIIRRDTKPQFITLELLKYLQTQKIIRPRFTTLRLIVTTIINDEWRRLTTIINESLTADEQLALQSLIAQSDTLSKLATLKQDAKNFKAQIMAAEREKLTTLRPFYQIAIRLFPRLKLSQQNILYYSSLIHYYTNHELREKIKPEQVYLYLLCYAWQRYQQIDDNLITAFRYHIKQFKDETNDHAKSELSQYMAGKQKIFNTLKSLVQLYIDDALSDELNFGDVRKQVFGIISKEELLKTVFNQRTQRKVDFYWQRIDDIAKRITINIRPLAMIVDFSSKDVNNKWFQALQWMKTLFNKQQRLTNHLDDCPEGTMPPSLQSYFVAVDDEQKKKLNATRYEFWIYRQIEHQFKMGEIFLNDSFQYKLLEHELASLEDNKEFIAQLNIPAFASPVEQQLDELFLELDQLWRKFNKLLKTSKIPHLRYDEATKTIHPQKPKINKEPELQHRFYGQLPICDIIDVFRFVDQDSNFLSVFTHIQPRYSKQAINKNYLIAAIIAQAMNNGNLNMSEMSDISYDNLQDTLESRIRIATLIAANDILSNRIAKMPIFSSYFFDMDMLYGAVDGQKFQAANPTIKARHSKKHFGKGKGVVAYTMLTNHIALQVELIGAHEHESYFAFDIWHNNTADIIPDIITGDMHCINKLNFILPHWFGAKLAPRFTNLEDQRQHLYCSCDPQDYKNFIIQPVGQLDRELMVSEWSNLKQIIATLALKDTSQSTIVRKLNTYSPENRTRKALFEFDKLIRSIYTLNYFINPDIQKNTHHSQNRVEAYHQLRGAIAEAYGKKELIGKTDIALEISNQCGRLVANTIGYYNSTILSKLLVQAQAENNQKLLSVLKKISPIAHQHIHFQGHLKFSESKLIDLDEMIKQLVLNY